MLCEVQKSLDLQGCNCFRKHKHQMSRELKRVPCTEANRVPGSYFTVLTYWQNSRAGGSDAPAYAIDLQLVKRDLHDGPAWVNIALCQPAACMAAIPILQGRPYQHDSTQQSPGLPVLPEACEWQLGVGPGVQCFWLPVRNSLACLAEGAS